MRITKHISKFFSLIFACLSCNTANLQQELGVETEIVDFSRLKKVETDYFPDNLINSISYVILDDSLDDYHFRDIDILKTTDNRIYILDAMLRKLVVFNSDGLGIGKVGSIGQGPEEYLRIHDFCLDDAENIYFRDGTGGNDRLFVFDKELNFVSVRRMPFNVSFFQRLSNNKFLFALHSWNKGDNASAKIAITNNEFKTEKTYMQYDKYFDENRFFGYYTFAVFKDKILYNQPINNFVYEFSTEGEVLKAYYFDFGNRNVPNEDKIDVTANWDNFQRYTFIRKIALINDKFIAGQLLDERKVKAFIVDRTENTVYVFDRRENGFFDFLWYNDNRLVSCIYPGFETANNFDLPQEVIEHLEAENFVLCMYELK